MDLAQSLILKTFPNLRDDLQFEITSKRDVSYNCIAWAALYDNLWIWPILDPPQYSLEGVKHDWPIDLPVNQTLDTFIMFFNKYNYSLEATTYKFENGFQKVAIFVDDNLNVTHAARQKIYNGRWASKLGESFDIEHSNPYDLEGKLYGKIAIILKRPFL